MVLVIKEVESVAHDRAIIDPSDVLICRRTDSKAGGGECQQNWMRAIHVIFVASLTLPSNKRLCEYNKMDRV
jgi:hypothetical protein